MKNLNRIKIYVIVIILLFSNIGVLAANSNDSINDIARRADKLERQVDALKAQIDNQERLNEKNGTEEQIDIFLAKAEHRPFVISSPVFGMLRPDDNYSDLLGSLPTMNEDLVILELRQKMDNYAKANHIPFATRPVVSFSGGMEVNIDYRSNHDFSSVSKSSFALKKAELDIIAEVSSWATGAIIINYDDSSAAYTGNVAKWNNSRLRIDRAWMTLGKLTKNPFYFTIGQVYAPFGNYGTNMVTTPMIISLGQTKDRLVILGFNDTNGSYAQIFAFNGETKVSGAEFIRHTGVNIGHRVEEQNFIMNIGAGVIGNLAESQDMQNKIFAANYKSEKINSRVFGLNGHIKTIFFGKYILIAEYIGASNNFNKADLEFNNTGAKPQAFNFEGSVAFNTLNKPSSVFAGFGTTSQSLGLEFPKQSFCLGYAIAPAKYVNIVIEYRHDINYAKTDTGGRNDNIVIVPGRHNNRVTTMLGLYF